MEGLVKKNLSLTAKQILSATGGTLLKNEGTACFGVSIDTRTLSAGELFVAIQGDRFDGHHFVKEALDRGARGVVIRSDCFASLEDAFSQCNAVVVGVEDTLRALQDIASFHRRQFVLPFIGVTGSNGKTTTKEMIASILQERWSVLKNRGNLNNHIGVPLTLFQLEPSHQAVVSEMGISDRGELARLCEIAQPTHGVITNIGPAHLEKLGSLEGVAKAKGELLGGLQGESVFAQNLHDPYIACLVEENPSLDCITFGLNREADVAGRTMETDPQRGEVFQLCIGGGEIMVQLPLFGSHHILNALAASAVASRLGFSMEEMKRGLEKPLEVGMRMELCTTPRGVRLINDAYNANPGSMKAALETLIRLKGRGKGVAVLAGMLELGEQSEAFHEALGRFIGVQGLDLLMTVGEKGRFIARGALEAGMEEKRVWQVEDVSEASSRLAGFLEGGEWVLIKGSRRMGMEFIVEKLMKA